MSFFTGFLLFFLAAWLFFRLFGKAIITWVMKRLMRKVQSEMQQQSQRYQDNYSETAFEKQVYDNEEIKVTVKKNQSNKKPDIDELGIDEVEFEELS